MADIAQIGFSADTSELKDAKASIAALVPVADKADKSSAKLSNTLGKVDAAADKLDAAARGLAGAADKLTSALTAQAGAADRAAAGHDNAAAAVNNVAGAMLTLNTRAATVTASYGKMTVGAASASQALTGIGTAASGVAPQLTDLNAHVMAYRKHLKGLGDDGKGAGDAIDASMMRAGNSLKFTATEGLNASRQLADIGVTALSGMSPFLIAIQQGPQLFDILQNKAATTGQTIGAVFRAAGVAIWTALAPLLPLILGVTAVVGGIAAAFALGARQINQENGKIIDGLGLTEKQLKRVEKAGVETTVTMGDTFKAFFQVLSERLATAFDGPLTFLAKAWNDTMDSLTTGGAMFVKDVIGRFTGAYYAIVALWKNMPTTFAGIASLVGNAFASVFETLINRIIGQINGINSQINSATRALGMGDILATMGDVKIERIANKQAEATAAAIGEGYAEGYKVAGAATDRFFADVGKRAVKNRTKLIKDAAGDAAKTPKGPKSDADKFQDIVRGANNDIATQRAAIEGVNLSADAALRLANEQKLLNEASSKGIKLTDEQRGTLMALAGTLTDLQIKLKNLKGFKEISEGADQSLAALKAEGEMIGLVGEALLRARYEEQLFSEAKAKGIVLDTAQAASIRDKAAALAEQAQANARNQFMVDVARDAAENVTAMQQEYAQIGMNADEVARLKIENELLAQARQKNIDLTPADVAAIKGIADEQVELRNKINSAREALDFAKEGVKGFVSDLRTGLEQGKGLFKSFADAVGNVLDKILNKLVDIAINAALGGGGGGIGGFLGGLGGLFGGAAGGGDFGGIIGGAGSNVGIAGPITMTAKGAAFDRGGVVSSPTLYGIAGGGGAGMMGEAGPEAVLPLARGPDGSLGVKSGGGGGAPSIVYQAGDNHYTIAGAVSMPQITAEIRRTAEQTTENARKSVMGWVNDAQMNGTVA